MSDASVFIDSWPFEMSLSFATEDVFSIPDPQRKKRMEENYDDMLIGAIEWISLSPEITHTVEGTFGGLNERVQYIDKILIPTIFDIFQDMGFARDIKNPYIEILKSRIEAITAEAEILLCKDSILLDVSEKIISKIENVLHNSDKEYRLNISISSDPEVPDWEEFVISILVDEDNFDEIIKIWDTVEVATENIVNETKQEKQSEASHIDWIDENLVIEVKSLGNV